MLGLIKDLAGMFNQLSLNTLTFRLIDHYQKVVVWTYLSKNKDQKRFLWCHVGHINPSKEHSERIKKTDKKIAEALDYDGIEFPVQEKDFNKIEVKNNICINVFGYENGLVFPIYVSDQKFEDSMDLLLLIDDDKSHYVCIKDFDRFIFHKTKSKYKKYFCKGCLQCFSSKNVLTEHKEDCLILNGKQSAKLEKGTIDFENYFDVKNDWCKIRKKIRH